MSTPPAVESIASCPPLAATKSARAAEPDFGPNVQVFSPEDPSAQARINALFADMEAARFTTRRHALLFKPGDYALDVPVGFYTHVAGLGRLPGDVRIRGAVRATAAWLDFNATCNFWRIAENLRVTPPPEQPVNLWSASQAAPLRRLIIDGDLRLMEDGWASGGFIAQCHVQGAVLAGSQQQYCARNNHWAEWRGGAWSMILVGNENPPAENWPDQPHTVIPHTPLIREKPFLVVAPDGSYHVVVPALRRSPSAGVRWTDPADRILPLSDFQIVRADRDTAGSINAALAAGKHLLVTPGQYPLGEPLVITRSDTVVLGLGLPTFTPIAGTPALLVEAAEDVILAGLVFDAGPRRSDVLVRVGRAGQKAGSAAAPCSLHDIFMRVGGPGPGAVGTMLEIHHDHVIGDHFWLWRADHGHGVGWNINPAELGLLVTGDHVTCYGLAAEHARTHQVVWNGEDGRVFFFQAEMPYDPPGQHAWMDGASSGYAAYKVGPEVRRHHAVGLGVYHIFKDCPLVADRAIEAPSGPGIGLRRMFTVRLGGGFEESRISRVLNDRAGTPHPRIDIMDTIDS